MNREEWLHALCGKFNELFKGIGYEIPPNIKISCGFPSKGVRSKSIGECWDNDCSDGKFSEIFISPKLDEPLVVASTLVHEIIHATIGVKEKHNKVFKDMALKIGLEGKMTATVAGEGLKDKLTKILSEMDKYPHSKLNPRIIKTTSKKNSYKIFCVCGYIVRTSPKWIARGVPTCFCGKAMELEGN